MTRTIDVLFDGHPGPEMPRFVEVEDDSGASVARGEWIDRGEGYWALRFPDHEATQRELDELKQAVADYLDDKIDAKALRYAAI